MSYKQHEKKSAKCPLCGSYRVLFKHSLFDDLSLSWTDSALIYFCRSCSHWFSVLKNKKETAYCSDYYIFNKERLAYDSAFARHCVDWLSRKIPIAGKSILDVGCGHGFFCEAAAKAGAIITGIEPSITIVQEVRARTGLNIINDFFGDIDDNVRNFDIITMWDVFEHFDYPAKALTKAYFILKEGSYLSLSLPNHASIFAKIAGSLWRGYNPFHVSHFEPNIIINLLQKHSFKVLSLEIFNNNILSAEGIFRLALKDRLKVFMAAIPFCRSILLRRRDNMQLPQKIFTGHNDYLESTNQNRLFRSLETAIGRMKLGDEIRILSQKV